jgi:DNA-binding transcriptional regulator YiaG
MDPSELIRIRKALGWSQTQAAAKLKVSGNTWARWERGEVRPHQRQGLLLQLFLQKAERIEASAMTGRGRPLAFYRLNGENPS